MCYLSRFIFFRSALPVSRLHTCDGLAGLGTLHDHAALVFGECQHDCEDQVARQGILDQTHVQDVNTNPSVKQLPDSLDALDGGSGEAVKLTDNQSVTLLQGLQ